jgi:glycopeptide antibiotics resistance protein
MSRTWSFFLATVVFIIAATFPWDLQDHPHWQKVAWVPFATGIVRPLDMLGNVALYFPFGFFLPMRPGRARVLVAAALATLLSGSLELSQVWSHWRFPSATDLVMNVTGSVVGALVRGAAQ